MKTLPEILRQHGYHTIAEVTGPLFPVTGLIAATTNTTAASATGTSILAGATRSSRRSAANG